MFKPQAPQLPPYPANGSWIQRTAWTTIGTLKWLAFMRMKSFLKTSPDLTPSKIALVNVALVCIGLVILQTGWTPLSWLGLFPVVFGMAWLLLVQPFIRGEQESGAAPQE